MSGKLDFANQPDQIIRHIVHTTWDVENNRWGDYNNPEDWVGWSWIGRTSLTYAFPTSAPTRANGEQTGFTYPGAWQPYVAMAFELWDDLIALRLDPSASTSADITVGFSTTTNNGGSYQTAFLKEDGINWKFEASRIWLNASWAPFNQPITDAFAPGAPPYAPLSSPFLGGRGIETILHEIGHGLGLFHPGPYDDADPGAETYLEDAKFVQDTRRYSIMSYFGPGEDGSGANWGANSAMTPMVYDIAAIQLKYGADPTTRATATTYGFNATGGTQGTVYDFTRYDQARGFFPVLSIYDANGEDVLDVSTYTQNQAIDLRPGFYSSVGALVLNIGIALNTWIEDARGGSGNDTLRGNILDNVLDGGAGADSLNGDSGFDWASYMNARAAVHASLAFPANNAAEAAGDRFFLIEGLIGSRHGDTLQGSAAPNEILGGWGNDRIDGFGGRDSLYGEGGSDTLVAHDAVEVLNGGGGIDIVSYERALGSMRVAMDAAVAGGTLNTGWAAGDVFQLVEGVRGGAGNDTLEGRAVADTLQGGWGNDLLVGFAGNDSLQGDDGDDVLRGGAGRDRLNGGRGTDTADYSTSAVGITISMVQSTDMVAVVGASTGDAFGDTFTSIENLVGSRFRDRLIGNELDNRLDGGAGFDSLEGGAGNDTYVLGFAQLANVSGSDAWPLWLWVHDEVTENPGEGHDLVEIVANAGSPARDYTLPDNVEAAQMTGDAAFTLTGNALDNHLYAGSGRDLLAGGGGADWMAAGMGWDTLQGGSGNDTYVLSDLTLIIPDNPFEMIRDEWDLVVEPVGGGTDSVIWVPAQTSFGFWVTAYDLPDQVENLYAWADRNVTLHGNALDNSIEGGQRSDTIIAGDGADTLLGKAGLDDLHGGWGDDTYLLADISPGGFTPGGFQLALYEWDRVFEQVGGGTDTVIVQQAPNPVFPGTVVDWYTMTANVENGVIVGNAGFALEGNDLDNRLTGSTGADTLGGGAGAGADTLDGGAGRDVMAGGWGADTFLFSVSPALAGGRFKTVLDFEAGLDRIGLSLSAFDPGGLLGFAPGALDPARFAANASGLAATPGAQLIYNTELGRLLWDPDGNASPDRVVLATLSGAPALAAADIVFC